jgi:tetratricopeptide (TPR) repeat protein
MFELCQDEIPSNILLHNQKLLSRYHQSKAASAGTGESRHHTRISFSSFHDDEVSTNHMCKKDVHNLREVNVASLENNNINDDCFLNLTVVDTCYFSGSCLCILVKDPTGELIELLLYNYFPLSSFDNNGGEFWFPIGTRILLKEPYLVQHQLRVDNTQNLMTCRPFSIATGTDLKAQGNHAFKQGHHREAGMLYTLALGAVEDEDDDDADLSTRTTLYSNRAAASLRVGEFREAIVDCDEALRLCASNFKAGYRKAQALMGRECYSEALVLLEALLSREKHSAAILADLEAKIQAVKVSIAQRGGIFDFLTLPFHPDKQGDTSSYLGPLEIRSAGACGRGLYLTRDVLKGELLLAEDPIAFNFKSSKAGVLSSDADTHDTAASTSSAVTSKDEDHYGTLVDLIYMASKDKQKNALLSVLSSEKESIDFLPDIQDVYLRALPEDVAPLSVHSINGICLINCFCMEIMCEPSVPIREAVCRSVDMMKSKVIGVGTGRRQMNFEPQNIVMEAILDDSSTASDIAHVLKISSKAAINKADPSGFTALHYACIMQSEVKCSLLLRAGAAVDPRDELGMTPLHFAASQFFNKRIVAELFKNGADVNAYSNRLLTPLFLAVEKDNRESIALLLECGADCLLENDQHDSALQHAKKRKLLEVFRSHVLHMVL